MKDDKHIETHLVFKSCNLKFFRDSYKGRVYPDIGVLI